MNTRSIIFIFVLFLIYIGCFYLTQNKSLPIQTDTEKAGLPTIILPTCKDSDVPLGISSDGYTYCQHDKSIHLLLPGKDLIIVDEKLLGDDEIAGIFGSYLVTRNTNMLHIYALTSAATTEFDTLTLAKNETLVSAFGRKDEKSITTIYLSTVLEAQSPKDIKSKIYKIVLPTGTPEKPKLQPLYSSTHMEKAVFAYPHTDTQSEILFTKESYSFLAPLSNIIISGKSFATCPVTAFGRSVDIPYVQISACNGKKAGWYEISKDTLLVSSLTQDDSALIANKDGTLTYTQEQGLKWQQQGIKTALELSSEALQNIGNIFFIESTNTGKRVYNCIDFGESSQITLRSCIPNL